ncbi:3cf67778-5af7-47aa-9b4a-fc3ae831525c [Sclerotinia trifoliorum]|uniref:3cf67778-5af7-47aa-9b4a-fc3ae831525c n=1 Tax=Sclerotinia trifoliorum TaxID=28548 RepID=A0A8H2VWT1_9HELO|nr:3cf67778-5af7-47aa-9b4a-fc3ae831525c [Sclerotinia trifoliorum]
MIILGFPVSFMKAIEHEKRPAYFGGHVNEYLLHLDSEVNLASQYFGRVRDVEEEYKELIDPSNLIYSEMSISR